MSWRAQPGFGDSNNDEETPRTVGCGVAMGNAKECVKQVADAITDTNEEDGVATFIEYVLQATTGGIAMQIPFLAQALTAQYGAVGGRRAD
ncbi:MAG: HAD hydrolase family protein [Christensenellales bacterium]